MSELVFLNIKQRRSILDILFSMYGMRDFSVFEGKNLLFKNTKEQKKLYLMDEKINDFQLDNIRIDSFGLYVGEVKDEGIRLSIEGSSLVGPFASSNVVSLGKNEIDAYIVGEDVSVPIEGNSFVIVENNGDFFGGAKLKDGKLLNHYPKERRVGAIVPRN